MAFDSRQDSDGMDFRSLDGVDFFAATRFNIGAVPAFHAALDTPFETLERATFAYRTHTLNCCPCGQDHSAELLAHKSAIAAGALQAQGAGGPMNAPAGSQQSASFSFPGEIPGDVSTTFTLNIGDTIVSQVETSGDQDWFLVELQAGVTYEFALNGTGATPLGDPFLEIMSSTGVQLKTNDDGGTGLNSLLRFTPTTTGVYYINAHGWADSNGVTGTGSYALSAVQAPPLPTYSIGQIAQYLVNGPDAGLGPRWQSNTITYNIEDLNADERAMAERALNMWATVTPLTFVRTTGTANITFVNSEADDPNASGDGDPSAYARTSTNGSSIVSSLIVISSNWAPPNPASSSGWFDSYAQQTYIHEIGHALGLGHSGPYNGTADYGTDNIYTNDIMAYTVMSYFDQLETGFGSFRYVLGLQQADIAAAQLLYGTNPAGTFNGNTTFGFNSSAPGTNIDWSQYVLVSGFTYLRPPSMTIYDTGGVDTINLSGFAQPQILDLRPGTFSSLGDRPGQTPVHYVNVVAIAANTIIENAIGGSGNDTIVGNAVDNMLTGGAGNDTLTGGAGADTFVIRPSDGSDSITDYSTAEDRIEVNLNPVALRAAINATGSTGSGATLNLGAGQSITFQQLTGGEVHGATFILNTGYAIQTSGTNGNDIVSGSSSAEVLNGLAGNDSIYAGAGDDYIVAGDGDDIVTGDGGIDYVLGGEGADTIYGNDGDDMLHGEAGIDILIGGLGADILTGGNGNDYLYGDDGNDELFGGAGNDVMVAGSGNDRMEGGIAGVAGFDYFYSGAGDDVMIGGSGFNVYIGDEGNDTVIGGLGRDYAYGGNGNDTLSGGHDIDILIGEAGDDVLDAGEGQDYVYAGTGNDILMGGDGVDFMLGEDGNDILNGGRGVNYLYGGAGADVFVQDFRSGAGIDVISDFELGVDKLRLINSSLTSFGQALASATFNSLGFTEIATGSGSVIWLAGDVRSLLQASDFEFLVSSGAEVASEQDNARQEANALEGVFSADVPEPAPGDATSPGFLTHSDHDLQTTELPDDFILLTDDRFGDTFDFSRAPENRGAQLTSWGVEHWSFGHQDGSLSSAFEPTEDLSVQVRDTLADHIHTFAFDGWLEV